MDRIALRNDQQTTIAISFERQGKTVAEVGDTILVAATAITILTATYNLETGLVDVVPVDDAVGLADVTVTATLADGTVLPPQTVGFDVKHVDADAVHLKPGAIVDKTASVPLFSQINPPPVVIAAPETAPTSLVLTPAFGKDEDPTIQQWVAAGYKASAYPPSGHASKSTPEEIAAAVAAENAANAAQVKMPDPPKAAPVAVT